MKKIITILRAFVMVLSLCACETIPPEMSKDTHKVGKDALEVMDDHLSGGIDAAEAEKELAEVYDKIVAVMNSIKNFVLGLRGEVDSIGKVPDLQKTRDFLYSTLTGADLNKG